MAPRKAPDRGAAIAFADQVLELLRLVVIADQPDDNRRVPGVTGVRIPRTSFQQHP